MVPVPDPDPTGVCLPPVPLDPSMIHLRTSPGVNPSIVSTELTSLIRRFCGERMHLASSSATLLISPGYCSSHRSSRDDGSPGIHVPSTPAVCICVFHKTF